MKQHEKMDQQKQIIKLTSALVDVYDEYYKKQHSINWLDTNEVVPVIKRLRSMCIRRPKTRLISTASELIGLLHCMSEKLSITLQKSEILGYKRLTYRDIYHDLAFLKDRLVVDFDKGCMTVTTKDICLEHRGERVDLGKFKIHISYVDICQYIDKNIDRVITVTSIDNPEAQYPHPHMNYDSLCMGNGRIHIVNNLMQGFIVNTIDIIERILGTYNSDSAYRHLEEWYDGITCPECGEIASEEYTVCCRYCDEVFCDNCVMVCDRCDRPACKEHMSRCASCKEYACEECFETCEDCGRSCCESCTSSCTNCESIFCENHLEEDICEKCREELEEQDDLENGESSSCETGSTIRT